MKKSLLLVLTFLVLTVFVNAEIEMVTTIVRYEGNNINKIKKIYCKIGSAVNFQLPEGINIKDFSIGDTKFFAAESNGRFGMARPINEGGHMTNVTIYTDNNKMFVFQLIEISRSMRKKIHGWVIIELADTKYFKSDHKQKKNSATNPNNLKEIKDLKNNINLASMENFVERVNYNYKVKFNKFFVDKVIDNGVSTIIYHPKCQELPIFYLKQKNKSELILLDVFPRNGHTRIDHVLNFKDKERFVLKRDNKVSYIKKIKIKKGY